MDVAAFMSRYEAILKERKIKKMQFYKDCGFTDAAVSQWRKGKNIPSMKNIKTIADYLGVTVEYLLTGNLEQKENPTVKDGEVKNLTPDRYGEFLRELPISELMKLYAEMGEVIKERMG